MKKRRIIPQHRVSNFDTAALKKRINQAIHRGGQHRADGTFKVSKRGKYNANGRWIGDHWFPSRAEADRYQQLVEMEEQGIITELEVQPRFPCVVNGVTVCIYIADFRYRIKPHKLGSRVIIEDVKGVLTPVYRVKRKLIEALYAFKIFEVKLPKLARGKGTWHGSVGRYRWLTADQLHLAPKEEADDNRLVGRTIPQDGREGQQDRGDAGNGGAEGGEGAPVASQLESGAE